MISWFVRLVVACLLIAATAAAVFSFTGRVEVAGQRSRAPSRLPPPVLLVVDVTPPALALAAPGALVVVGPSIISEVPGVGPGYFSTALALGDLSLATALANELRMPVPAVLHVPVAAFDQTIVELAMPVESVEGERIVRHFDAGRITLDTAAAQRLFALALPSELEPERVARQSLAWRGWLPTAGSRDASDWAGDFETGGRAVLLKSLATAQVLSLPVAKLDVPGEQGYRLVESELGAVRDALKIPVRPPLAKIAVLIADDSSKAPLVARRLINAGFEITNTGRVATSDVTRVVVSLDDRARLSAVAEDIRNLLGAGRIAYQKRSSSVFDVTLVIGRDWAQANGL